MSRIPVLPTVIVLIAVAIMIRLGFWQIDRMHEKAALLASYQSAAASKTDAAWPASKQAAIRSYFRHTTIDCRPSGPDAPIAGRSARGEAGWAHMMPCALPDGGQAEVVLGWSTVPAPARWEGGLISGTIAQGIKAPARLVADPPLAGLGPSARPDPKDVPNNHWSYAVQWFLFAATALVIYGLALRKRLAGAATRG